MSKNSWAIPWSPPMLTSNWGIHGLHTLVLLQVDDVLIAYLGFLQRQCPAEWYLDRPAYPKILLSVLQTACVCIFRFLTGFLFYGYTTNQSKQKKVSKDNFSIIHLIRTVCELTLSTMQTHYRTGTLWHSDAFILFTSAKVVLDQRL